MKLLFSRCLEASYKATPKSGNYAIETDGDTLYLLFQWSRGFLDWVHNFLFPAKPYKRMDDIWFCHRGFLRVWRAMRDDIEKSVALELKIHPKIKNIVCVGYSHGGALSLLATEDMEFIYGNELDIKGYGFGAPRIIWGFLPRSVKNRLRSFYVVRNIPDIVTHVPPAFFGFRHAGVLVKIGEKRKYTPIKAHFASAYKEELSGDLS